MLRHQELSPPSEDESPVKFLKMSCKYFTDGMVKSLIDAFHQFARVSVLDQSCGNLVRINKTEKGT